MDWNYKVQYFIIDDFEQIKQLDSQFIKNPNIKYFLIPDENLGLKAKMKTIVDHHFSDYKEALNQFYDLRNSLLAKIIDLQLIQKEQILEIEDMFVESEWMLEDKPQDEYAFVHDQIVGIVSLVMSRVVALFLENRGVKTLWIDNRDFVLTDDDFIQSIVNYPESREKWRKLVSKLPHDVRIVVIQKDIGGTPDNATTIVEDIEFNKILAIE